MPGLVGFTVAPDARCSGEPVLRKMQDCICHLDSHVKDELFCGPGICASRVHIDAIQQEPQPFRRDGLTVWLDGEFYNRDHLDRLLAERSDCDSARLVSLLGLKEGFAALREIDGIFSAVVHDATEGKVHLVSDRYGLRHLYWSRTGDQLMWASELKAFLALPAFRPRIDRKSAEHFFGTGYLLEDYTWFEETRLLSPGSVMTWNLKHPRLHQTRYWSWSDLRLLPETADLGEVVEELGRLFVRAVERRCNPGERIGVLLSGGLDSRAILAAVPGKDRPVFAATFGMAGSGETPIAARVADLKGAQHITYGISADTWLLPRFELVWWTDGQLNLMHMHAGELTSLRQFFDICLSGYLGDATIGGSYLDDPDFSEIEKIQNRGRRFITMGQKIRSVYLQPRFPFFDNDFIGLAMSIPAQLRRHSHIYKKMLLHRFPSFFQSIPWHQSGYPIGWPDPIVWALQLLKKIRYKAASGFGLQNLVTPPRAGYSDYPGWIRQEPAKTVFRRILGSKGALHPEYVQREEVTRLWKEHLAGANHAERLCAYLTFEIWLQQVFESRYLNHKSASSGPPLPE